MKYSLDDVREKRICFSPFIKERLASLWKEICSLNRIDRFPSVDTQMCTKRHCRRSVWFDVQRPSPRALIECRKTNINRFQETEQRERHIYSSSLSRHCVLCISSTEQSNREKTASPTRERERKRERAVVKQTSKNVRSSSSISVYFDVKRERERKVLLSTTRTTTTPSMSPLYWQSTWSSCISSVVSWPCRQKTTLDSLLPFSRSSPSREENKRKTKKEMNVPLLVSLSFPSSFLAQRRAREQKERKSIFVSFDGTTCSQKFLRLKKSRFFLLLLLFLLRINESRRCRR